MAARTTSLVVCGAGGRMGRRIITLASEDEGFRVVAAVEAAGHAAVGRDAGEQAGIGRLGVSVSDRLDAVAAAGTVIVDFTTAEASLAHLRVAAEHESAIVVGSTGFSPEQRRTAERLAAGMPTLIAPNMSLGVNVLVELVEEAVRRLGPGFDCEIVEVHHGRKKDAPSGTARALADAAAEAAAPLGKRRIVETRSGLVGERPADEIGVFALRGGDAVGDHTVMLIGTGERLELTHRASSRDCLARGALRAAEWIVDRPAGLYSMRDVVAEA